MTGDSGRALSGEPCGTLAQEDDGRTRDRVALYDRLPVTADASWWARTVQQSPGDDVLYLGCGAGRLLVPVARACGTAVAIDVDPRMIRAAAARIAAQPPLEGRVHLAVGRAESPPVGGRYGAVLLPSCLLNEILTRHARAAVLAAAARRCRPGGRVALQVFNPYWVSTCDRWEGTIEPADGGAAVAVTGATQDYDPWAQVHRARLTYRFADGTALEQAVEAAAVFPAQLHALTAAAGLRITERWGARPGTDPLDATTPTWHLVCAPLG